MKPRRWGRGGHKRIEIYYSFIGAVELPEKPDKKDKSA